jgi:hypothetical protein
MFSDMDFLKKKTIEDEVAYERAVVQAPVLSGYLQRVLCTSRTIVTLPSTSLGLATARSYRPEIAYFR